MLFSSLVIGFGRLFYAGGACLLRRWFVILWVAATVGACFAVAVLRFELVAWLLEWWCRFIMVCGCLVCCLLLLLCCKLVGVASVWDWCCLIALIRVCSCVYDLRCDLAICLIPFCLL